MEWGAPRLPWSEMERRLSGRPPPSPVEGDGGDSPAWTRKREPYVATVRRREGAVAFAELHAHSHFSFLDGASPPEELVETAAELGLEALALTDHDGLYGVVRFAEAAAEIGLPTVFGAELSLGLSEPQNGVADPEGRHLMVLARGPMGYARLSRVISAAHRAGNEKGRPVYDLEQLAGEGSAGDWVVLTGCRKGAVPAALETGGLEAAHVELDRLVGMFGKMNVAVEIWDHSGPTDTERADALAELAAAAGVDVVATTNAHYGPPSRGRLAAALAAVRARRSLDELDGWLPACSGAFLRSGEEMAARFARHPHAVSRAAEIGLACAFDLRLLAPRLPPFPVPDGHTEASWLRHLALEGAERRYGPRGSERVRGAWEQIDHELNTIEALDFPGYFLVVWDIVEFCRREGILCQGRGSAANSAVCYALGITVVDAVAYGLLFARFLAPEREGPPDIDLDIASGRREEVIQYVYGKYGRDHAALVANLITYRPKSAVRDMAKALGYSHGQQDAWSKQIERWGGSVNDNPDHTIPPAVVDLADQVAEFPRHLGIHPGGMVICDRPVVEVIPVEWARMADRTVIQLDKDGAAAIGLVKFDLLGLGMLSAMQTMLELIPTHYGQSLDLAALPQDDPRVFDMLCAADTVGVFQVESRAQMSTLPRLRPRKFYDLVVEVGLIRPGPIQGGSVHPYLRRHAGLEEVSYPHHLLRPALEKTLGVPLFQEQMMEMAIDAASFSPDQADELRRAMGSKHSAVKMANLRERLFAGMAENGITGPVADDIYDKLQAFSNFGFAESHAISFAYIVYSSSFAKVYYPAAFYTGLLNAQPMGFYSPQSLIADARRHGISVLPPDINASAADATLEDAVRIPEPVDGLPRLGRDGEPEPIIRLGLSSVRRLGDDAAERVAAGRPYTDLGDLARRTHLATPQLEALAAAGAFDSFGLDRRQALWAAGPAAGERADRLADVGTSTPPVLPAMSIAEQTVADLWATGVTTDRYPTELLRPWLTEQGVTTAAGLRSIPDGTRVWVGGIVTHRQRPATASGITFMSLEDETGLINVICSPGAWTRNRATARDSAALLIRGRLERAGNVTNILAEEFRKLPLTTGNKSRDFR